MLRNLWEQVQSVRSMRSVQSKSMYYVPAASEKERKKCRERGSQENTRRRERVNFALNAICFLYLVFFFFGYLWLVIWIVRLHVRIVRRILEQCVIPIKKLNFYKSLILS